MKNSKINSTDQSSIAKIFFNVSLLRGLSLIFSFALVVAIPIYFPPEAFGSFSLAFSIIQISCAAIIAWPNQSYLRYGRELYKNSGSLSIALGARLAIHFVMVVVLCAIIFALSGWVARYIGISQTTFQTLFLFALLLMPLPDILLISAQACNCFWSYGWSPIIQRSTQLLAILGVAIFSIAPTWELLLSMSIIGYGLSAFVAWYEIPSGVLRPKFYIPEILKLLKYSWAMPLATLGAFLLQWMDLWFIRKYLDEASVGYYAWAYTIILLVTNVLVPLAAILSPRAIDMRINHDEEGSIKIVKSIFSICLLGGVFLPLLINGIAVLGALWIPEKYLESLPVILVLSSVFLCQMAMSFMEPLVYAREYLVSRMVSIVVVMVLIKAALNLALIPIIGIMGSAIATVICYGIGMILQWFLLGRVLGHKIPSSLPIFILAIISMVLALLSPVNHLLAFLLSLVVMIFGVVLLRRLRWSANLPLIFARFLGCRIYNWLIKA